MEKAARPLIFGTDLDNTIIDYQNLIREAARSLGAHAPDGMNTKPALRDWIRSLPQGETLWQKIQAEAYGRRIHGAPLNSGFDRFARRCKERSIPIFIISHKTEFATQGSRVNLRTAAMSWLEAQGFFDEKKFGISSRHVFFEGTFREKISRIKRLGCTHFADDMEEVLLDAELGNGIDKLLFSPGLEGSNSNRLRAFNSWHEISEYLFGRFQQGD
ncbi:MAG: hypothetical protein HY717_21545 [Planctomycetes bacterium]|nr:hypothetical protein [Planctomycetota bacterium]